MDCIICNVDHKIINLTDCVEQENIFFTLKRLTSYYYKFWKLYLYLTILSRIDLPATIYEKNGSIFWDYDSLNHGRTKGEGDSANAGKTNVGGGVIEYGGINLCL